MAEVNIAGVKKSYGDMQVIHGIDCRIADGEFLVLLGPSGCGKSTLLRMVAGLERADAGRIAINGTVMDDAARLYVPAERRGLGMVFQDFALWPHMSCLENVALALPPATPKRNEAAQALLARLGVAALAPRRPAQLSGGQQQRVGIARALAARPKLLLLDEPLSSLDLGTRAHLREALRESVREAGISALLVTHDPEDCWALADQVAVLEEGVIRQYGTPSALWSAPASPYIARFTGALGGIQVPVCGKDGMAMLVLGGQPLALAAPLPSTGRGLLFWRDDAFHPAPDGNIEAEALSAQFQAGRFLVRWRVPGLEQPVSALLPAPVAPGPQRICARPGKFFLFHEVGDA